MILSHQTLEHVRLQGKFCMLHQGCWVNWFLAVLYILSVYWGWLHGVRIKYRCLYKSYINQCLYKLNCRQKLKLSRNDTVIELVLLYPVLWRIPFWIFCFIPATKSNVHCNTLFRIPVNSWSNYINIKLIILALICNTRVVFKVRGVF